MGRHKATQPAAQEAGQATGASEPADDGRAALWRRHYVSPFAAARLALLRLRRSWLGLLAVGVGLLATVTLICVVPLYNGLVANIQLQRTLANSAPPNTNIEVTAHTQLLSPSTAIEVNSFMQTAAPRELGGFTSGSTEYIEPDGYFGLSKINGKPPANFGPVAPLMSLFAFNYAQAASHMRILAGRLPRDTTTGLPEVMVTPKLGLAPGATMKLQESTYRDGMVTVKVVGVWSPKDQNDPFWNGRSYDTIAIPLPGAPPPIYPVLFTRAGLLDNLNFTTSQPDEVPMGMILHYLYFTQSAQITYASMNAAASQIRSLRSDLNGNLLGTYSVIDVAVNTHLDMLIVALAQQFSLFALPLYVVVAQIIGLALLFILVMTQLLVEGQAMELATLRSRGASLFQLLANYLTQGLALGALALALGPLLAAALSVTLARYFVPGAQTSAVLRPAYLARVAAPASVALPALAGATLGLGALLVAAYGAAQRDTLAFRRAQGRGTRAPFWQRLYLDVALAALCVVGYVQLTFFGDTGIRAQLDQVNSGGAANATTAGPDPLLLLTPGLLLLAGALLLLRLFPLVARLGMALALRRRGATDVLAFAQLTRAGAAASRLALTLTVAIGLGLFALTYQSSFTQSTYDRAAYLTGSNERVVIDQEAEGSTFTTSFTPIIARMQGVQAVSQVYRSLANAPLSDGATPTVSVLAIEPQTFAQVANWQRSYASQSLPALLQGMISHEYSKGDGGTAQGASPYVSSPSATSPGTANEPIYALLNQTLADALNVHVGDHFHLAPSAGQAEYTFALGAIVNNFPTLYAGNQLGYMIVDAHDYIPALESQSLDNVFVNGPDEFWLRTTADPRAAQERAVQFQNPNVFDLLVQQILNQRQTASQLQSDPVSAGMVGLLLLGALLAVLFAIVIGIAQALAWTRQRRTQLAILRTLGFSRAELVRLTLGEMGIIVLFSMVGGTALGLLLTGATLPFLQFSATLLDATTLGGPDPTLVFNPSGSLVFYSALLVAFGLTLLFIAGVTRRISLSSTLRLAED